MDITYNNKWDYDEVSYLTFTEIPNILKAEQIIGGSGRTCTITMDNNLKATVTGDGQYYVTLLGETITNVMSPSDAKNKRFYIASDTTSTAYSMAQAFRNCSSLSAQFNIIHSGNTINFIAKEIGETWGRNYFSTNITPNQFIRTSFVNGQLFEGSDILGGKIIVDVYKDDIDSGNYVTTLEKNWYGDEVAFDMSPVLATFSEYGKTVPYFFNVSKIINNGEWSSAGTVSAYTTIGYHCNQSEKYLEMSDVKMLMHNLRNEKDITRYVYGNSIPYSVLIGKNVGGWSYSVSYKDSAFNEIYNTGTLTDHKKSSSYIADRELQLVDDFLNQSYYIDVTLANETYRFNVIKPLKAAEYYQRVCWRNEYGGISFFDFTGARSETDSVEIETYEKNVFDYHETSVFERKKIYKNDYDKTVKLTSHLMEESGKYIFNSLMMSKKVWTYINGKTYYIIPKSIEVAEDGTYNNIYKATLTYSYSDI